MAPDKTEKSVCVMDADGRLGSNLVEGLLKRGYVVHAAVQNHGDLLYMSDEFLSKNKEKLRIFRCDPLDYQSILDAVAGCSGLFYSFELPSYQSSYEEFVVEDEVRAAHNVLEACAQTETIERVVFTSSVTAVIWRENSYLTADLDERNWSDPNFCRKFKLWHALAKTLAEKTAWALAMDRGVDMVSINGGLLAGSDLSLDHPYLKGAAEMYQNGLLVTVDMRFLVDTYFAVFENPSSYGRYLCFNGVVNCSQDAVNLAHLLAPSIPCSLQSFGDAEIYQQKIYQKKLNKLMVDISSDIKVD